MSIIEATKRRIDTTGIREDFKAELAGMGGPEDWGTMEFNMGAIEDIIALCDQCDALKRAARGLLSVMNEFPDDPGAMDEWLDWLDRLVTP